MPSQSKECLSYVKHKLFNYYLYEYQVEKLSRLYMLDQDRLLRITCAFPSLTSSS